MQHRNKILKLTITGFFVLAPVSVAAQEAGEAISVAAPRPLSELLPGKLAGVKARTEVTIVRPDDLGQLVGDRAAPYREYLVRGAASRAYGAYRVDVFETESPFAAFGLFTYNLGKDNTKPVGDYGAIWNSREIVFRQGSYFVRVSQTNGRPAKEPSAAHLRLAHDVALSLPSTSETAALPALMKSLPAGHVEGSTRYFLGPESLGAYLHRGREMFGFAGDAEAVMAEYGQKSDAETGGRGDAATPTLSLVIVEYHTPQFAYDAFERVSDYLESLGEQDRNRIIIKRQGNYIVEAANFDDREYAEHLVDSIEYPYTVKWLRNPLWATDDPFRQQKAAQMLLSTFGILGLILLTVLAVGFAFGTTIFLKRRKLQQEIFSDAGGMLRLGINQFEAKLLGLPAKRD